MSRILALLWRCCAGSLPRPPFAAQRLRRQLRRAPAPPAPAAAGAGQPAAPAAPAAPARRASRRPGRRRSIRIIELRFQPVNESLIEPQTYLYYIQTPAEPPVRRRLGAVHRARPSSRCSTTSSGCGPPTSSTTCGLRSIDAPYPNGVMGKHVIFHMEERPRVKIVDYTGSTKVERTKVDEKMKEPASRCASTRSSIRASSGASRASSAT